MSKYKLQNAREIAAKIAERLVEASGTEETVKIGRAHV